MTACDYRVICAASVEELLEWDLPADGAVIVVDLGMDCDFSNVCPERLHGQGQTLPVIYLTDHDTDRARRQARRVGAAGYFRKPIDEQALVDAISFSVRHSHTAGMH